MKQIVLAYAAWIAVISVISVIVTVKDKISAKKKARRTRESTLLLLGALGGAFAMFVTMLLISHKTLHAKFMIPLPLFAVVHILILVVLISHI